MGFRRKKGEDTRPAPPKKQAEKPASERRGKKGLLRKKFRIIPRLDI